MDSMDLRCVTITGADDSVPINILQKLSADFPFVEWGILASKSNEAGCKRFPSPRWLSDLQSLAETTGDLNLSLHLCGRWVRDLLIGHVTFPESYLHCFRRVQLNFHAERTPCVPHMFADQLYAMKGKEFIFQIDGAEGNKHMTAALHGAVDECYPLFDCSGGAGVVPNEWPKPFSMDGESFCKHGYAGGLGPQNLAWELRRIGEASKGAPIWIDMETHVRSNNDRLFDVAKVRQCLEIAAPFVQATIPH